MTAHDQERYDVAIVGVGIGANYGSVLTYYSLYKTLENMGNRVLMVSKIGAHASDPEISDTHSMRFAKKHYNLSRIYNLDTVKDLNKIADTFVIGSDQVWNYGVARNFGKAFYLDFADDTKRKISYAASYGHKKDFAPEEERPKITKLLMRFNAISVREDSAVDMARDVYNVPATQVAEPIFLTPVQNYLELAKQSERDTSGKYLLAYILDPTPEKTEAIRHIAGKLGLNVRIILDGWHNLFEENKGKIDIPNSVEENVEAYDFLKLYANASYVLTDSFHGTAFALKFNKPFASIGNRRRGVTRFDSMFHLVGHHDRFTLDPQKIISEDARFLAPMDYSDINKTLDKHVKMSRKWLQDALRMPAGDTIAAQNQKIKSRIGRGATARKMLDFLKFRLRKHSFRISQPAFITSNAAWTVSAAAGKARISVTSPENAVRGNLIWMDFPSPLHKDAAYRLTIRWSFQTQANAVNLHIRNPQNGKFKVIGTIPASDKTKGLHTDSVEFKVPSDGFSQFMLGAFHFTGKGGGAEIASVAIEELDPKTVVAAVLKGAKKKTPAAVVQDLGKADDTRFIQSYAQNRKAQNIGNSRSLMMFYSHGFEKGLSRTGNFRAGFGEASMVPLAHEMNKWLAAGHSAEDSFFQIGASVLHSYFERHKKIGVDVSHFFKLFAPAVQAEIEKSDGTRGGIIAANAAREPLVDVRNDRGFIDVVYSRRSVREFTSEQVSDAAIQQAVEIALQAPSVCNRQPARVHQFQNPEAITAALALQGGFRGYTAPPKLLLVTSDLTAFVGAVERNQAFVDGGLFMMMLLLGLEEMGLGACSLNTAMGKENEASIRKILGIPDSEVFISFIAVGHFNKQIIVPRSKRIPVAEVLLPHK